MNAAPTNPTNVTEASHGPRIFISYRRSDRALAAQWVHREVAGRFGHEAVFFDVDGIPPGFDYRDFLQQRVSECDVLLAIIGDDWLDVRDADGRRRLENKNDFVRIEIEAALRRKIPVIPVLVENASMPSGRDLPSSMHQLAYRQACEVRGGQHVDDHFRRLNEGIERAFQTHVELQRRSAADNQQLDNTGMSSVEQEQEFTPDTKRSISHASSITSDIGMQLVLIPPGRFMMGSPETEPDRRENEGPQHEVELTKSFYMGVHPVTQEEYQQVVGNNPSHHTGENRRPVESITWSDAIQFCNRLSEREQLEPFYTLEGKRVTVRGGNGYRLPTEAEWEYSCRAGTTTRWWFGDEESRLGEFAWYGGNAGDTTHPVGEKPANPWGLCDVHGNVWEWCWDWYGKYSSASQTDPTGPETGTGRVLRGGSWGVDARDCRSAVRVHYLPVYRNFVFGFRAARTYNMGT